MAQRHYFVTLLCLSLFIVACLLVSLVISRTIGTDLEAEHSGGRQTADRRQSGGLPEVSELRTIDLVDLTECDKTFAFTRRRLQVRVLKSSPVYRQRPQFLEGSARLATAAAGELVAPQVLANRPNGDEETQLDAARFFLTSTRDFVAGAAEHQTDQQVVDELRVEAGERSGNEKEPGDVPSQERQSTKEQVAAEEGRQADDPLASAASEMGFSLGSVNSSLIDCFIVDIEKRYNQKILIEDRHRKVASTRRVGFGKMLDTIKACRWLTWTTLINHTSVQLTGQLIGRPDGKSTFAPSLSLTSSGSTLNEIVKPVEQVGPAKANSHDLLSSILRSWLLPDAPALARQSENYEIQASGQRLPPVVSESRESAAVTRPSSVLVGLAATSPAPPTSAEDEARRGSYLNMGMSMVSGIVPNTLWCGLGDRAANYSELGAEFKVDSCCRAHDHCPIRLKPFATDYGLINWSVSTRSHCGCDLDFADCLTSINSTLSNVIKTLYFRLVGLQCIDVEGRQSTPAGVHPSSIDII